MSGLGEEANDINAILMNGGWLVGVLVVPLAVLIYLFVVLLVTQLVVASRFGRPNSTAAGQGAA